MTGCYRLVAWALLSLLLAVGGVLAFAEVAPDWTTWRQATCMPTGCFNERVRSAPIRQPSNTFSSLAFLAVGCAVISMPRRRRNASGRPLVSQNSALRIGYGLSLATIGLGSAFYHMSMTFVGQTVDVLGMYLLATYVVIYGLAVPDARGAKRLVAVYATVNAALLLVLVFAPQVRRYLFAAILVIGLVLEFRRSKANPHLSSRLLLASAGVLIAAFAIWLVDNAHLYVDPAGWLQGHAVWHVMGAVSCALLYRYYDGESCG